MFIYKTGLNILARVLVLTGILLTVQSCSISDPCGSCDQALASESFAYTFSSEDITDFSIKGVSGNIQIEGFSGDSIEVWGERLVRADSQSEALSELKRLNIGIKNYPHEIGLETGQPSVNNGRSYEVQYQVRLPFALNAAVEVVNGNITITGLTSRVLSSAVNGNVLYTDIQGSNTAATVNGSITGNVMLAGQQACSYSTVNGNVLLTIPEATSARLEASVVNGRISIQDLVLQNLKTTRTSASGLLGDGEGLVQLQTVNGNVRVNGYGFR